MKIHWSKTYFLIALACISTRSMSMDNASDDDSAAPCHSAMQDAPSDDESRSESFGEECAICLEPLGSDTFMLSPCNHRFDKECIDRALRQTDARCPLCRTIPDNVSGIAQQAAAIQEQRHQRDIENIADQLLATHPALRLAQLMAPHDQPQIRQQLIQRLQQEQRQMLQQAAATRHHPNAWNQLHAINARNRGYIAMPPRPIIPVGIPENNVQRTWQRPVLMITLVGIVTYLFKDTLLSAIFGEDDTDTINVSNYVSSHDLEQLGFIEQSAKDNTHENDTFTNQSSDQANGIAAASKIS